LRRTRLTLALALVAGSAVVGIPSAASAAPGDTQVQFIAMNDFHGRIAPQSGGDGQLLTTGTGNGPDGVAGTADDGTELVGGAAYISAAVQARQAAFAASSGNGASYFVGAGDLISASPFNSSVFRDEPTIEVLNAMGLDVSAVGNHEFDRGQEELYRVSAATDDDFSDDVTACEGVTPGVDGCFGDDGHEFEGAEFPYLAANVVEGTTIADAPILPPYELLDAGDNKRVALIGVVTSDTANIVSPDGIAGLTFLDEAETINYYSDLLTDPAFPGGPVEAIGVLIHEGGSVPSAPQSYNGCAGALAGTPIAGINAAINTGDGAAVDFIVSAHTHVPYNCTLPGGSDGNRLVTQAGFYGKVISDIRLELGADGDVDRTTSVATNVPVLRTGVTPDPTVQAIVDYWEARASEAGSVQVGSQTGDLDRAYRAGAAVRDSESSLGNLIADSQLAYARSVASLGGPDVDVAFMNPGGIRADINCASSGAGDPNGNINFAETFAAQPFSNTVNTVELDVAAIDAILEQQWAARPTTVNFLQLSVSSNLRYDFDDRLPLGQRVSNITLDGAPLPASGTLTVAANSFLITGGDSFKAFTTYVAPGSTVVTGGNDVDALNAYVLAGSPVTPPAVDRANSLNPAATYDDDGSGLGPCDLTSTPGGTGGTPGEGGATPGAPGTPGTQPVANPGNGIAAGNLANTGAATGQLTALGAGLLLAGVVATAAGYRRGRGVTE
ncbi:5'-Nucleotidase/apyrase, partial [Klenkia terrae]